MKTVKNIHTAKNAAIPTAVSERLCLYFTGIRWYNQTSKSKFAAKKADQTGRREKREEKWKKTTTCPRTGKRKKSSAAARATT
jgi:hypothetical protein